MHTAFSFISRSAGVCAFLLATTCTAYAHHAGHGDEKPKEWTLNATILEASTGAPRCSYDSSSNDGVAADEPAGPPAPAPLDVTSSSCRYNRAIRVNRGRFGDVSLDGVTLWMAGVRGDRPAPGEHLWAMLFFDPAVSGEQRDAMLRILPHLYRIEWLSFTVAMPAPIAWDPSAEPALARADGGQIAEIALHPDARDAAETYGTAPRQTGLRPMRGRQKYHRDRFSFASDDAAGLVVTIDMSSHDIDE